MKNFLKVEPKDYAKERKIGRVSFAIKRAMILALFIIPLSFLSKFFLDENFSVGEGMLTAILISAGLALSELALLEYQYQKNKKRQSNENENYGEVEK